MTRLSTLFSLSALSAAFGQLQARSSGTSSSDGRSTSSCAAPPFLTSTSCASCITSACQATIKTACNAWGTFSSCYCPCTAGPSGSIASCTESCTTTASTAYSVSCIEASLGASSGCGFACGVTMDHGGGNGGGGAAIFSLATWVTEDSTRTPSPSTRTWLRRGVSRFANALVVACALVTARAAAQGAPAGPYTASCKNMQTDGPALAADCQTRAGTWVHTVLPNTAFCTAPILNNNGVLQCPATCTSTNGQQTNPALACFEACYKDASCKPPQVGKPPPPPACTKCLANCGNANSSSLSLPAALQLVVPLYVQQQTEWCWAATTQMITSYFGQTVSQCQVVDTQDHLSNCCDAPPNSLKPTSCGTDCCQGCDCGNAPPLATYGLTSVSAKAPPTWEQLTMQFACNNTPMAFAWNWCCGGQPCGGHVMVAFGYEVRNGVNYVWVMDPEQAEPVEYPYDVWASTSCADNAGNTWAGENINIQ